MTVATAKKATAKAEPMAEPPQAATVNPSMPPTQPWEVWTEESRPVPDPQ